MSRSAFEAIPGKDALLEYIPKVYPEKTYVEKDGLVYKSIIPSGTSNTFISSQWELIADLREVRVANILDRNALTGNTPTSGTTGIRIPILDNTNVLVLNAIADPQVAANKFARYNYNQTNASWLLLQAGTGASSANTTVYYSAVLGKVSIVSGITVTAGGGLIGGGSVLGTAVAPFAAGGTITVSHADTSSQANISNSGYGYVQSLNFDTYGHVTGATSSTWVHPDTSSQVNVLNSGYAYIQSISVDGSGHVTSIGSSTWVHPDTSSQANVIGSGNVYIQGLTLDGAGHVTSINTGTIPTGGIGFGFKLNGDSGGVLNIASGATVTISGGTNISTVRTGGANNAGVRLNFIPAGATTQVQLNNAGFLGASANFTYNTGTNILTSPNLTLSSAPTVGTLADNILIRGAGGALQTILTSSIGTANNGLNKVGNNYRLGGALTGNTTIGSGGLFDLNFANKAWTFGSRGVGTVGINSLSVGSGNVASTNTTLAIGINNISSGVTSYAFGQNNIAGGNYSFALGVNIKSFGQGSVVIGQGTLLQPLIASGSYSVNISKNDSSQVANHGALAQSSAILGGINHNIDVLNTNAAIIGGDGIKMGSGYINHVAVPNLAIWTAPTAGAAVTDDVLVWNATDKKVKKVTQASLAGGGSTLPAGANTYVQYNNAGAFGASATFNFNSGTNTLTSNNYNIGVAPTVGVLGDNILVRNTGTGLIQTLPNSSIITTANNGLNKVGTNVRLGGALTGDTTIGSGTFNLTFSNNGWTFGSRGVGTVGANSLSHGSGNIISGLNSAALGINNNITATGGFSFGYTNTVSGSLNVALNSDNTVSSSEGGVATGRFVNTSGIYAFAGGKGLTTGNKLLTASGRASFNYSENDSSQINGHGATGSWSAILGGFNHNVGGGASIVLGGQTNKLTSGARSAIIAGASNTITAVSADGSIVMGGQTNLINESAASLIASSYNGQINTSSNSVIIGSNGTILNSVSNIVALGVNSTTLTSVLNNHTVVSNLAINTTPTSGAAVTDDVLVWNTIDKKVKKVTQASLSPIIPILTANNGINKVGNNFRLGGALTGNTTIGVGTNDLTIFNNSITIGSRGVGSIGGSSMVFGIGCIASGSTTYAEGSQTRAGGQYSHAEGQQTVALNNAAHSEGLLTRAGGQCSHAEGISSIASGYVSHAEGQSSIASSNYSHAQNYYTVASGDSSHAEGSQTIAGGQGSHAQGVFTKAMGTYTHTGGQGTPTKYVSAYGASAFNYSSNDSNQINGNGANGQYSVILGGLNQSAVAQNSYIVGGYENKISGTTAYASGIIGGAYNRISNGVTTSVILGGQNIILTGASQANHAVVPNLMIWNTPIATVSGGLVNSKNGRFLYWNSKTKQVCSDTYLQYDSGANALTIGTRNQSTTEGYTTVSIGFNNKVTHNTALVVGNDNNVTGSSGGVIVGGQYNLIGSSAGIGQQTGGIVIGGSNRLNTVYGAHIFGTFNTITANFGTAVGQYINVSGSLGIGMGQGTLTRNLLVSANAMNFSTNTGSQTIGHGALASASIILGGQDHNIDSTNQRAAIIGGNAIKLGAGGLYTDYVAVPSLALFTTPVSSIATDLVLAWNSTDKKVKLGTLASTSDVRLKKDFTTIENVVDKISTLDVYEYANNEVVKPMEGIKNYGLTAQQVENVFPHVVKDNYDYEGEIYKTVDYRHLVPVLFAAIKELNEKIKELESKIK